MKRINLDIIRKVRHSVTVELPNDKAEWLLKELSTFKSSKEAKDFACELCPEKEENWVDSEEEDFEVEEANDEK